MNDVDHELTQYDDPGAGGSVKIGRVPGLARTKIMRIRSIAEMVVEGPTHVLVMRDGGWDTYDLAVRGKLRVPNRYSRSWAIFAYSEGIDRVRDVVIRSAVWDMETDLRRADRDIEAVDALTIRSSIRSVPHGSALDLRQTIRHLETIARTHSFEDRDRKSPQDRDYRSFSLYVQMDHGVIDAAWDSLLLDEIAWDGAVELISEKVDAAMKSSFAQSGEFALGYYDSDSWWVREALSMSSE